MLELQDFPTKLLKIYLPFDKYLSKRILTSKLKTVTKLIHFILDPILQKFQVGTINCNDYEFECNFSKMNKIHYMN